MVNTVLIASGFIVMTAAIVILTVLLLRKKSPNPSKPQPPHLLTSGYAATPKLQQVLRDDSETDEDEELKERLLFLFEGEKLYLHPDIRITEVAERLLTNKTHLSRKTSASWSIPIGFARRCAFSAATRGSQSCSWGNWWGSIR